MLCRYFAAALLLLPPMAANSSQFDKYTADTPPGFSLPDLQDVRHSLADYRGKVVLVNFWASWCPPCVYEMPGLAMLQQRHAEQPFTVLALNVGEKKYQVRRFVGLVDFTLPVLLDTDRRVFRAWGVETLPTSFLVDPEGHIRYRTVGSPDWEEAGIDALIDSLMPKAASPSSEPARPDGRASP